MSCMQLSVVGRCHSSHGMDGIIVKELPFALAFSRQFTTKRRSNRLWIQFSCHLEEAASTKQEAAATPELTLQEHRRSWWQSDG